MVINNRSTSIAIVTRGKESSNPWKLKLKTESRVLCTIR